MVKSKVCNDHIDRIENYTITMKQGTEEFLVLKKQRFVFLLKIKKSLLILRSILFLTNCGSKTDSPESVKEVSSRVITLL